MSWTTNVTLWCDGQECPGAYRGEDKGIVDDARREAKEAGWEYVKGRPAKDYCPECARTESKEQPDE